MKFTTQPTKVILNVDYQLQQTFSLKLNLGLLSNNVNVICGSLTAFDNMFHSTLLKFINSRIHISSAHKPNSLNHPGRYHESNCTVAFKIALVLRLPS